jgi:chromosome partitioning protein
MSELWRTTGPTSRPGSNIQDNLEIGWVRYFRRAHDHFTARLTRVTERGACEFVKVISFFNHKGGVGKTTIVLNVALALRELGKKVLLVDADAQANLTGLALGESSYDQIIRDEQTIWAAVSPLVTGAGDLGSVNLTSIRPDVWLLAGDLRLSNFESILPVGWTEALAGEARGFRVTSAMYRLLHQLGNVADAEYIFVDLGPNIGALNRSVLIATDGFVVPVAPDLFSLMALPSVGNSIREWSRQWVTARSNAPHNLNLSLPEGWPRPIGYISQQFSVYGNRPTAAFQTWVHQLEEGYEEGVLRPLDVPAAGRTWELGSLRNFASLIPIAQKANKALFELSGSEARGAQFTRAQQTRDAFTSIAKAIVTGLER